jgi:hypothetical protein
MITQDQLKSVSEFLSQHSVNETEIMALRQQFPGIHFTYCMDDDVIAANPLREEQGFNLYLIDSSNHCLGFTQDLAVATGIVVAEIEDS